MFLFSAENFFPPGISLQYLFPRNQSADIFFPEVIHTLPLKRQMVGPLTYARRYNHFPSRFAISFLFK